MRERAGTIGVGVRVTGGTGSASRSSGSTTPGPPATACRAPPRAADRRASPAAPRRGARHGDGRSAPSVARRSDGGDALAGRARAAPSPARRAACGRRCTRRGRLAPAVDLAQAAPLVEAAAQLLGVRVVVGVQDRRAGHVRLGVAGAQHVDREHPVLGVGHLAKRRALPGRARDARVGVGEEPARADQRGRGQALALALVPGDPRAGAPSGASDSNQRSSSMRTAGEASGRGRYGPYTIPTSAASSNPPSSRSSQRSSAGSASWVRNATCAPDGLAHQQVARAAVAEALGRDLQHARAVRTGQLRASRRVSRSRTRAARVRPSGSASARSVALEQLRRRRARGWRRSPQA